MSAKVTGPVPQKIIGWLFFLTILASIIVSLSSSLLSHGLPRFLPGLLIWGAAIFFLPGLSAAQKKQVYGMSAIGVVGLTIGFMLKSDLSFILKALEANQMVIAMISAVSLLKVINPPTADEDEILPRGRLALLRTIFGVHAVGSAINISALFLVSDRLSAHRPLSLLQAVVVSRAFSTCPFWSPFFAAMGIILVSAPGAELTTLMLYSLPVTILALSITVIEVMTHPEAPDTRGYPMHLKAVWLPVLLAVFVIAAHNIWPEIPVLTLITVICLIFTLCYLGARHHGHGLHILEQQISGQLPRFSGEVAIIFAASLLAAGIAAVLNGLEMPLPIDRFGAWEAIMLVVAMLALSMTGMHPVGSVSLFASLLTPVVDNPNLLGAAFLMGWGLCIGLSPFSGLQISLASRYHINRLALMRTNWKYMIIMLACCTALLHIYDRL